MDEIFDWNLGNMIYNGLITLRLCGFSIVEIRVVSPKTGPGGHERASRFPGLGPGCGLGGSRARARKAGWADFLVGLKEQC